MIKRQSNINAKLFIHIVLGLAATQFSALVLVWVLFVLLYEGIYKLFAKPSSKQVINTVSYMAAMEMLVRMSGINLPHEYSKYAISIILFLGIIQLSKTSKKPWLYLLYFLALLPSVPLLFGVYDANLTRQYISFNLAGPFCLTMAVWFFYRRPIKQEVMIEAFRQFIYPMVSTLVYLLIRTPKISEIDFTYGANFEASGYGPNQMSSLLGFGILIIGLSLLLNWKLFKPSWIVYILLVFLGIRVLLTFSRGGVFGPLLVLSLLIIYFGFTSNRFRRKISPQFSLLLVTLVIGYAIFQYVNDQTSGILYERYAGLRDGEEVTLEKYTSGRTNIIEIDFEIFRDNPLLGIGPGAGADMREDYGYGQRIAAHIELLRLPAEHGLLGVFSLLILIFFPVREFFTRKSFDQRILLFVGVVYCLSFMLHSATRIALPMLMYGMGFMYIIAPAGKVVSVISNHNNQLIKKSAHLIYR